MPLLDLGKGRWREGEGMYLLFLAFTPTYESLDKVCLVDWNEKATRVSVCELHK